MHLREEIGNAASISSSSYSIAARISWGHDPVYLPLNKFTTNSITNSLYKQHSSPRNQQTWRHHRLRPPPPPLLQLPGELRNEVYALVFAATSEFDEVDTWSIREMYPEAAATQVCSLLRRETLPLYEAAVREFWSTHSLTFRCCTPNSPANAEMQEQGLLRECGGLDRLPRVAVCKVRFEFESEDPEDDGDDTYLDAAIDDEGDVVWNCRLGNVDDLLEKSQQEWATVVALQEAMERAIADRPTRFTGKGLDLKACISAVSLVSTPRMEVYC